MKFSILSVILATTICVLGIKIYQDQGELSLLRKRAVEQELSGGTFSVEEAGQFYLRRLHCAIPNTMRFRIYVPSETETSLHLGVYYGGTEAKGYMATQAVSVLPGESIISVYSDTDFTDKDVRTLHVNIQAPSSGSNFAMRLEHFKVYSNLKTEFNSWFRAEQDSIHGPLQNFSFGSAQSIKALLHLPDGVEKTLVEIQEKPAGVAIWLAPKPKMGPIDSRFETLETVDDD